MTLAKRAGNIGRERKSLLNKMIKISGAERSGNGMDQWIGCFVYRDQQTLSFAIGG